MVDNKPADPATPPAKTPRKILCGCFGAGPKKTADPESDQSQKPTQDTSSEATRDLKPQTSPEPKTEPQTKPKPKSQTEPKPEPQTEPKPDTQTETESETEPKAAPDSPASPVDGSRDIIEKKEPVPTTDLDAHVSEEEKEEVEEVNAIVKATSGSPLTKNVPADVKLTLAMFAKAVTGIGEELIKLANEWQSGSHSRVYQYANMSNKPTGRVPKLPRHVVSLPKMEAFSSVKIGEIVGRAHAFLRSQMPLVSRLDEDPLVAFRDVGYDIFKAFFGDEEIFPMPRGILGTEVDFWKDDDCFAQQFLNGCNPTVIEKPADMDAVNARMPKELHDLTDPDSGRTVLQLLRQGALFWADYAVFQTKGLAESIDPESGAYTNKIKFDAASLEPEMTKYFYAPFVAFYKRKSNGRLGVLGIVLTRHKDKVNHVYNSTTCKTTPNVYIFAKMHVSCADNQMHQFYSHLGRCHLIYEPFGVAVRNVFAFGDKAAQQHIVGRLLGPHFADHMAINWLARNTLIAHGDDAIAFTDVGFALGTRGGLSLLMEKYRSWKFEDQAFPMQLKKRGFDPEGRDGLSGYYYRDDGMRIWRALEKYVRSAIEAFYEADSDENRDELVSGDELLDKWCVEMRDREKAFVLSFPKKFESVDMLVSAVTTIIYNVSAEHAAVNASQERYLSYVPNRPNSLFRPVPSPGGEKDMHLIKEVLGIHRKGGNEFGCSQPLSFAMFQVQFSQLLTLKPTRTLMELDGLKEDYPKSYKELMVDLKTVHYMIKARNNLIDEKTPHLPPYEFLDPVQVGQSIEI